MQIRLLHALSGLLAIFFPLQAFSQSALLVSALAARSRSWEETRLPDPEDPSLSPEMRDLMRSSQALYLRGSDLLKSGTTAEARACFDSAVDSLLLSRWDLAAHPVLNRFFRDLILRIQKDESLYLCPEEAFEEETEGAVVDELEKLDLIPIQVDPSLQDMVEADLLRTAYDIPIMVNESVLKSLDYWLTRGQQYFTDGLMRSGRYQELIQEVFRSESLPLDLMYLGQVESLFKTNALSRAYARGIWQFSRGTAVRYGLKVNRYIDERIDPEKSTRAAARYLKDLFAMFQDWNLTLAAYNWGEGKVQRLIKRSGTSDFWRLVEVKKRGMPRETRNHVPMILSSIILARNPEKYGLPVSLEPPIRYEKVLIPKRTSLALIAKTLGLEMEALKRLNPALKTPYTPASYPEYQLNIPEGTDPALVAQLAQLPAAKPEPIQVADGRYRVRSGDTLWDIAARYGTTVAALMELNDISSPKRLRIGSWLEVPTLKTTAGANPKTTPTTAESKR